MKYFFPLLLTLLLGHTQPLLAQNSGELDTNAVKTIEGTVTAVLAVISGEKGKVRDWTYFKSLFLPNARFTVLYHPSDSFKTNYETVSLDEFVDLMGDAYYDAGFTEYALGNVVQEYNGIAQVFQSFYSKDSEGYEGRGITSYQLVYFNHRWWISDVLWTTDSNGISVPEKYLNQPGK